MQPDKDNIDSEEQLTQKTRKRRRILKKIIRNNREIASDKQFEILINLDKELFAGYNAHRLGNFCIQENRLQLAEQNLLKANDLIQKKFIFTNVYLSLGNLYLKEKNLTKACEYYEKVLQQSPHRNSKLYFNKDQVIFACRLNSFNSYSEAHEHLIKIYLQTNQLQKAYAVCKASLELKQEEESCIVGFADAMEKLLGSKSDALAFAWKKLVEETLAKGYEQLVNFKHVQINSWVKPTTEYKGSKKISVVCLKWGSKYTAQHVNKLYAGVKRNTSWEVDFYCFTEDSYGINKNIKIKSLDDEWKKQWGKAVIFGAGIEGKKCYIDLDTVITGNLDELFEYDGQFATLSGLSNETDEYPHFGYSSSVIIWNGNVMKPVYDGIKGDFQLIERLLIKLDYWLDLSVKNGDDLQKICPQKILSFEPEIHKDLPETCSIMHFRKKPKPQNCPAQWVKQHWSQT